MTGMVPGTGVVNLSIIVEVGSLGQGGKDCVG